MTELEREIEADNALWEHVNLVIAEWLNVATELCLATFGGVNDMEVGARKGIEQLRHVHLDGYPYSLVPRILAAVDARRGPDSGDGAS